MKQFIKPFKEPYHWSVHKRCTTAGISRVGYYKQLNRSPSPKEQEDEKLANLMIEIYQSQCGVSGYRQMQIISKWRYVVMRNPKRAYRLMQILDLRSVFL